MEAASFDAFCANGRFIMVEFKWSISWGRSHHQWRRSERLPEQNGHELLSRQHRKIIFGFIYRSMDARPKAVQSNDRRLLSQFIEVIKVDRSSYTLEIVKFCSPLV
jgi:hypothetical protein